MGWRWVKTLFFFNFGRSTPPGGMSGQIRQISNFFPKFINGSPPPKHFLQCFLYFPTSCYSEVHIEVLQKPRSQSIGFHSPARGVDNPRPFLNNHRPVVTWICKSYYIYFSKLFHVYCRNIVKSKWKQDKWNWSCWLNWFKQRLDLLCFWNSFFLDQLVNNQTPLEKFWYYWQSRKLGQPV